MLYNTIHKKKNEWFQANDCTARDLVNYIRDKSCLRESVIVV